jgi:hypothetical protein
VLIDSTYIVVIDTGFVVRLNYSYLAIDLDVRPLFYLYLKYFVSCTALSHCMSTEYSLRQTIFRASAYAISLNALPTSSSIDFTYAIRPDVPDRFFGSSCQLRTVMSSLVMEITRYPSIMSTRSEPKQDRVKLHCKLLEKDDGDVLLHFRIRGTYFELGPVKLSLIFNWKL